MPLSENPYESSRQDSSLRPATKDSAPWSLALFVFLAIAIAGGLFSYAPPLALAFGIMTCPLFYRYHLLSRTESNGIVRAASSAAGIVGAIFLGVSVLAAAAGVFLGTCTVTSYIVGLPMIVAAGARRESGEVQVMFAIRVGIVVGIVFGIGSLAWILHHLRRSHQAMAVCASSRGADHRA